MPDGLVALLVIAAWCLGFFTSHALDRQSDPFWRGFIDGLTLRRLWQRR